MSSLVRTQFSLGPEEGHGKNYTFSVLPQPWRYASILVGGQWRKRQKIIARQFRAWDVNINGVRDTVPQGR